MCIIAVSARGKRQPSWDELQQMFFNNPDGAGYMTARKGKVEISKGYMDWNDFAHALKFENFGEKDPVVYHFRVSTQAGVQPSMTHPFPLSTHLPSTQLLDCSCPIGVAHNGIIRLTSDPTDKTYSDTAHYVAEYMAYLIRNKADMHNKTILTAIERTTNSKWALMDGSGSIVTIGNFNEHKGVLFSNYTYTPTSYRDRGGVRWSYNTSRNSSEK